MDIFLVGGAVRDEILGKEASDKDYVVVGSSPEVMLSRGYKQAGKGFPVFLHPETGDEYALARREVKSAPGHDGFNMEWEGVTLTEDLERRDLTINAIAKCLKTGSYYDPCGGLKDIEDKRLRHVSDHFVEDPLRVLRLARFLVQHTGFEVDEETAKLCIKIAKSGELNTLTGERIWKEMEKALACDNPVLFFEFLLFTGALRCFMPELANLYKVPQPIEHHPEGCCWTHTMLVLQKACIMTPRMDVRYAALVHDLGKGLTPNEEWPKHIKHEETGLGLVHEISHRFRVPNKCRVLASKVCEQHLRVHRCLDMKPGKVLALLKTLGAPRGTDLFGGVLMCCLADNYSKKNNGTYPQAVFLSTMAKEMKELDVWPVVDKLKKKSSLVEGIRQFRIEHLKKVISQFKEQL